MRAGKPAGSKTKPARQTRARSNTANSAALTDPDQAEPKKAPRKRYPSDKRSFLELLTGDARLSDDDKAAIRSAHRGGVTLADVAAMIVYEFAMARKFLEDGMLEPKDFIVATNKAASHATAAAQLGQDPGGGATKIEVVFTGMGPVSKNPDAPPRRTAHAVIGDVIDADG